MSSTNKPDRDWHDPPSLSAIEGLNPSVMEPQYREEGKFNPKLVPKWYRFIVIGLTYLFIGVAIEIGLFFNLPIEVLSPALLISGAILLGYGWYSHKKELELNIGG